MFGTALLIAVAAGYDLSAGVTPVQKVLAMMEEMKQKGIAEKEEEMKLFEEYQTWCKDTGVTKSQEIKTAAGQIEQLTAKIQKHEAAAVDLTDKVAVLDADIAGWKSDHKQLTELRDGEHADYKTTHADYSESVSAIERAIVAIQSSSTQKIAQAMLFVQTLALKQRVPSGSKQLITSLLQQTPYAYESSSGGVIEMLEKLKEQFYAERNTLEKEEMNSRHAYDMEALTLTDSIKAAEKESGEKKAALSDHKTMAAEAKGTLEMVSAEKAEDEKYLTDLKSQCTTKAEAFASRQQMREEEIAAIAEAIGIIKEKVSGLADKHLPSLAQKKVSLSLLRSSTSHAAQKARAAALLHSRGAKLGSKELVQLATSVSEDPFAKVIDMIKGLIAKLQEEAAAEADHKAWCDSELKDNKLTREAKTEEVNALTAKVDELNAQVAKLTQGINDHEKAMGEIDAAMAEATTVRQKEKAKNEETIADCEAAIEAVSSALTILKEFYKKAAGEELLQAKQSPADDAPASFSNDAYTGQQGSKRGVLDMLEVIHSDFSRLLSDTTADESESAREYESFMDESAKDRETKRLDQLRMTRERTAINGPYGSLGSATKDLKATQEELDAAFAYYDKLKPDCIQEGVSFAERAQRRQEEIDSLNEAYKILNGEAVDAE